MDEMRFPICYSEGRSGFASKRRELSHETNASAMFESGQKSSVVPSSGS